jgi:hypothetical protein
MHTSTRSGNKLEAAVRLNNVPFFILNAPALETVNHRASDGRLLELGARLAPVGDAPRYRLEGESWAGEKQYCDCNQDLRHNNQPFVGECRIVIRQLTCTGSMTAHCVHQKFCWASTSNFGCFTEPVPPLRVAEASSPAVILPAALSPARCGRLFFWISSGWKNRYRLAWPQRNAHAVAVLIMSIYRDNQPLVGGV